VLQATFPGRGVGEKAPLSRIAPFAPGLSEISALFVANGATQADLPAVSGLPGGTHYWFWAADNALLLTTLDTALINGGATLTLEQGTGACVFCTGNGWAAIGLSGGSGPETVNLIAGTGIDITGIYPDLTIDATLYVPDQVNLIEGDNISITGIYPDLTIDAVSTIPLHPLVSRQQTGSFSLAAATWTRVPFVQPYVDIFGNWDNSNHYFVAPDNGIYWVHANCVFQAASSISRDVRIEIGIVGLPTYVYSISGQMPYTASAPRRFEVSGLQKMIAGEHLEVRVWADAASLLCLSSQVDIQYIHPFS